MLNSWGYPDGDGPRNSAMVIGPSGDRVSQYDKIALVPFGEYVPARGFIPFMNRVPAMVGDVTAGDQVTLSEAAGTKLGAFICFEATRPEIARRMRKAGASALVQLSNEAWFGPTAAARQMLAHAVLRAVENDAELIRATNSGLSALIDRYGQIEGLTPSFETATRTWKVRPAGHEMTFYTRHGDVFTIGCLVIGVGALAAAVLLPSRKEAARNQRTR
jgi:apolipoprotein N-acyltransferase